MLIQWLQKYSHNSESNSFLFHDPPPPFHPCFLQGSGSAFFPSSRVEFLIQINFLISCLLLFGRGRGKAGRSLVETPDPTRGRRICCKAPRDERRGWMNERGRLLLFFSFCFINLRPPFYLYLRLPGPSFPFLAKGSKRRLEKKEPPRKKVLCSPPILTE